MALKLPRFQAGRPLTEEVTAEKLNQIVDAVRQCEVTSGVGYDVNRNAGGTSLTVRPVVLPQGAGVTKDLIGPANSGVSHANASEVVNPGMDSYGLQLAKPSGVTFLGFVLGSSYAMEGSYNESSSHLTKTITTIPVRFSTGVNLSNLDLYRTVGFLSLFQATAYDITSADTNKYATDCAALQDNQKLHTSTASEGQRRVFTDGVFANGINQVNYTNYSTTVTSAQSIVCSGVTYWRGGSATDGNIVRSYYTKTSSYSAAGNFRVDNQNGESLVPSGNYTFKRTFNLSGLSPIAVKIRVKIRLLNCSLLTIKLNGLNVSYSSFETQTSTYIPIEIVNGFTDGENLLEVIASATSSVFFPGLSFQFMPTSSIIVSLGEENEPAGFSGLTDAQQDLIGQGTPVQVLTGTTIGIYAYTGSGSKTSQASYDFIRNA